MAGPSLDVSEAKPSGSSVSPHLVCSLLGAALCWGAWDKSSFWWRRPAGRRWQMAVYEVTVVLAPGTGEEDRRARFSLSLSPCAWLTLPFLPIFPNRCQGPDLWGHSFLSITCGLHECRRGHRPALGQYGTVQRGKGNLPLPSFIAIESTYNIV